MPPTSRPTRSASAASSSGAGDGFDHARSSAVRASVVVAAPEHAGEQADGAAAILRRPRLRLADERERTLERAAPCVGRACAATRDDRGLPRREPDACDSEHDGEDVEQERERARRDAPGHRRSGRVGAERRPRCGEVACRDAAADRQHPRRARGARDAAAAARRNGDGGRELQLLRAGLREAARGEADGRLVVRDDRSDRRDSFASPALRRAASAVRRPVSRAAGSCRARCDRRARRRVRRRGRRTAPPADRTTRAPSARARGWTPCAGAARPIRSTTATATASATATAAAMRVTAPTAVASAARPTR